MNLGRGCIVRVAFLEKQATMTEPAAALTRLKKIAAFVAIVWSVAGSFVLFDIVASSGMDRLAGAFENANALTLPAEVRQSATCSDSNDGGARDRALSPAALATAWSLGVQVGARARWTEMLADAAQSQSDPQRRAWLAAVRRMVQQTDAEVGRLAASLSVPRPTTFPERNSATAPREFVTLVESDAQTTAHALARTHTPRACEAYKMGEYWGYSMMMRDVLAGERNVFAAEISHYARQLQVPDTLWRSMIARTPSNATTEQLSRETIALTDAVTQHFAGPK